MKRLLAVCVIAVFVAVGSIADAGIVIVPIYRDFSMDIKGNSVKVTATSDIEGSKNVVSYEFQKEKYEVILETDSEACTDGKYDAYFRPTKGEGNYATFCVSKQQLDEIESLFKVMTR